MCKNCFEDGSRKESTTSMTIEKNNCLVVIRNIPCFLCLSCGEEIIADDVSSRVEELYQQAKTTARGMAIVEY